MGAALPLRLYLRLGAPAVVRVGTRTAAFAFCMPLFVFRRTSFLVAPSAAGASKRYVCRAGYGSADASKKSEYRVRHFAPNIDEVRHTPSVCAHTATRVRSRRRARVRLPPD